MKESLLYPWFAFGDPQLTDTARDLIVNPNNQVCLNMASVWEMAIKTSLGRLPLVQPFDSFLSEQLQENSIDLLPIRLPHVLHVATLPMHHRDPFDRLLVAQSRVEFLPLVSADTVLDGYGVNRVC